MDKFCDLHTHSFYSDGTVSPAEVIRFAEEAGLSAVALCDHNTVAGLPEFIAAAEGKNVEAVPGMEFSTDYSDKELHILALFIAPENYDAIAEKTREMLQRKEKSNIELTESLKRAGYDINYDEIKASTPEGTVNRAVIAAEMVRKRYCESVKDALGGVLSETKGNYVPPKRLEVFDTIRFIKSIGAVSILAHPLLNLNQEELCAFLQEAVRHGLDGMETYYSTYTVEETKNACRIAKEFGLLPSGGSDFHGENKPDIRIGTGKGNLRVSQTLLERLKKVVR